MQVLGVYEALAAVFARERKELGVLGDLVILEMLLAVEALTALGARVQRLRDVLDLVLLELVLARESHRARRALERLERRVTREQVTLEMKRRLERHAALGARLVLVLVVEGRVSRQILARLERVTAMCVLAHVRAQLTARVVVAVVHFVQLIAPGARELVAIVRDVVVAVVVCLW